MTKILSPPDYEKLGAEKWKENCKKIINLARYDRLHLNKKINTFCENFNYNLDDVKIKVKKDDMFAACFATDPNKQGFYQITCSNYIKKLPEIKDFKSLPANGKKTYHINEKGKIIESSRQRRDDSLINPLDVEESSKSTNFSKALNFYWEISNYKCYAYHVYKAETGGTQNKQHKFIEQAMKYYEEGRADKNTIFFIICDGTYYTERDNKKLIELKQFARINNPKSYVVTSKDLHTSIKNIINE